MKSKTLAAGLFQIGASLLLGLTSPLVLADNYPSKPIKAIVPFAPGSATDQIGRAFASKMAESLGQPVVIENRPGANGLIGADLVAKSPADGYTLLFWGDGVLANPLLYQKPPFDAIKDISGIALVATTPQVLVSNPTYGPNTMKEVLNSKQPLNYGTAGNGSPGHLTAELMKRQGATQLSHVPYKGGTPALTDLMGGQIQLVSTGLPASFLRTCPCRETPPHYRCRF